MRGAPVDVHAIAVALGVRIHCVREPGWEGALQSSATGADIWLRAESPRARQRYALAHELGHLLLHPVGREYRDMAPGTEWTRIEQQADAFASALLMPRFLLQPIIYMSNHTIEEMAEMFEVTPYAMSMRTDWITKGRQDP
jgi:Zn-dependent peptidase ImmA (M78 family)